MYHGFNYFEDRKQRLWKLITPAAKFLKNDHTNNTNDLNPELFENNQDHRKRSLSYDDRDLCTTHSVCSEIIHIFISNYYYRLFHYVCTSYVRISYYIPPCSCSTERRNEH